MICYNRGMELYILLVVLAILVETTFLTVRKVKNSNRARGHRKIFVDTSALIDGRILEVAKTGFLSDDFLIPRSVTRELQLLADGKDLIKRNRARAGLDVVRELERVIYIDATIFDDSHLGRMLVDERLIVLAKENKGIILTCDYNLKKVAETEGVEVLNVNDLAIVLSNKFQVGDKIRLKITEKGQNPRQGIGYLGDGTMVVVDDAENKVGEEVEAIFVKFHQTSAGRMIFADLSKEKRKTHKTVSGSSRS